MKLEETAVDIYHQLWFCNEVLGVEPEIARPCADKQTKLPELWQGSMKLLCFTIMNGE